MKKLNLPFATFLLIIYSLLPSISLAQITKLLDFTGLNGTMPYHSFIAVNDYLYGTTNAGGTYQRGVIYKIKMDGTGYEKLFDFDSINGDNPVGNLVFDGSFLYGNTSKGGTSNMGVIFKLKSDGSEFSTILNFEGSNGGGPWNSLVFDDTYLYGTTIGGGAFNLGTVYKIKTDGTQYLKLIDFDSINGEFPISLVYDSTNVYGMTWYGGINNLGVVFKVKTDGTGYSKLLEFNGINGKEQFLNSLSINGSFIYGTTRMGGINNLGQLFKIRKDGTLYQKLFDFDSISGIGPSGKNFFKDNSIYGITNEGGLYNRGVMYKIKIDGTGYVKLYEFDGMIGTNPYGSIVNQYPYIYGTTTLGNTIFKFNPNCSPIAATNSFTICEGKSVSVGNNSYSTTGTYYDTIQAVSLCDSVITTNIIISPSNVYPQSIAICRGQTLTIGNTIYTVSGNYTDTIKTASGCDSIVTTDLTVIQPNDTSCIGQCFAHYTTTYDTLQNRFILLVDSSTNSSSVSYYWDFGDGTSSTLMEPTHEYTIDSIFSVCLKTFTSSNDSCSFCQEIGKDSIGNIYRASGFKINIINPNLQTDISTTLKITNSFKVFPNPTSGNTAILFNNNVDGITINIINTIGKKVVEKSNLSGFRFNIEMANQSSGLYLIEIIEKEKVYRTKLIKK